jgi:diguanylate cyclase (GGDEF)-like protein
MTKLLIKQRFANLREHGELWHVLLLALFFTIGGSLTYYVTQSQDAEMRDNLITYANTIERSIDWRPFENVLNTNPNNLNATDLNGLNAQLNDACRANRECHFIYALYIEDSKVKFLLDASPQPPKEISHLRDVFDEATEALKDAMYRKKTLVEGPVVDRWGTWVSVRVPIKITAKSNHFVMLSVDVAANGWNRRVYKKAIVPIAFTFIFSGILLWFVSRNRKRELLLSELTHSTSALSLIAHNDDLTGLANRRLLEERMQQAIKSASEMQDIVAVLFLDLDFFKVVNDTHGHLIGDLLLKSVAERLSMLQRAEDTIARIGGDEFVVLLPKLKDLHQAENITKKIITELDRPFHIEGHHLQIGVSVGIAAYPAHHECPKTLIKCADDAMYVAKRQGRNRYAVYELEA